jgi:hypothetical protein
VKVRRLLGGAAGAALLFGLFAIVPTSSNAAEVPFTSCPANAQSWVIGSGSYPPFTTPGADSAAGLDGCTAPFAAASQTEQNVTMSFPLTGLPTDPCNTIVSASITSSGTPGGAGWGFVAYNVDDPTIHYTGPTGTGDGGYQQFAAPAGNLLTTNGATFYSPALQPDSGQYDVTYQLDPAQLNLATLAGGKVGVSAVVFDAGDTLNQMTMNVVLDDSACTPDTSSTTTTEESTTTTAAPVVQPATKPSFTG